MEANKPTDQKNPSQFVLTDEISIATGEIMRKRIDTFNPHRRYKLREIKVNVSYLAGEQDIQLVGDDVIPLDKERAINSTNNFILPAVQKDMAIGTSVPPIFDIVPAGTDDDDKATAIAGQKIFKRLQRTIGRDMKRGESIMWYDISGVGWRKVYWNKHFAVIGINPEPVNEDGSQNPAHIPNVGVGEAITEGEVEIDLVPTQQLIYDFRVGDLSKLKWIIHAQKRTADWVRDNFGAEILEKLSSKFQQGAGGGESQYEAKIFGQLNSVILNGINDNQRVVTPTQDSTSYIQLEADKYIDYYEYWAKPTKSQPTGAFAIMLGDQVVFHAPFPIDEYPHGELPFIPAAPISIQGSTDGGISRISQARPIQREINRLCSMIAENVDVMGNAVIFTSRNSKLRHKTLDNGAGNLIEYEGLQKPHREPGVPMSSQVFSYLMQKKAVLDEIFAFHGPLRGQAPPGVDSGKALQSLQSADIKHLGPIVEAFEMADERVVYQALTLALKNYPQGKMLNAVGDDYEWTIYEMDPEQLRGKFNVVVKQHSSMPIDKDAEAAQTFQIWSSGLVGDPQDPELRVWAMDQMHMGNNDALLQKHSKMKNFAKKEFVVGAANLKSIQLPEGMSAEQLAVEIQRYTYIPQINPFDDHMIHIYVHNEWMMDNFWKYREENNPIKIAFLQNVSNHIMMHQQIVSQQQEASFQRKLQSEMLLKKATPQQIMMGRMNFDSSGNQIKKDKSKEKDK